MPLTFEDKVCHATAEGAAVLAQGLAQIPGLLQSGM